MVCVILYTAKATGEQRCDCLYKFRQGQTNFNLILQKILRHKDRISCEKSVYMWCVWLCTQIIASGRERCDCLYKFRQGQTNFSLILSKKYCDTRIAYFMRNQCAGSVCGSVHDSWRQQERDSIVYTNSEKDRQISISSSPKYIATQASHIVWEIGVRVVCMVLYTAHGNRVREMRSLYKLRKRETGLDLILSKNLLRYKDRILCEKSVCSWCGFCTQLMAT